MAEARIERRLAAILAADIVGYSRLMEADEAGTLGRVKALRAELLHPKVAAYNGRIVKTTGDGTLIEFPSAVDAVQHAVEVQSEMARRNANLPDGERLELRMGINVGDVIIEGDDIYGDGVNVAARLESLAEPGGICISGTVHEHVSGKLNAEFDDMGAQSLKNIAKPIHVYGVTLSTTHAKKAPALLLPDKPSIAVLPFQNMSGDSDQDYFCDGMVEDIITGLSRIKWLFVIARNSTFTYKGRPVDVKQVGRELGVRYVLDTHTWTAPGRNPARIPFSAWRLSRMDWSSIRLVTTTSAPLVASFALTACFAPCSTSGWRQDRAAGWAPAPGCADCRAARAPCPNRQFRTSDRP
jgi:adenylate cyclase